MTSKVLAVATAAALVLSSGPTSAAADWFVSTSGADAPTCGTSAAPCRHIQYALDNKAAVGDTVNVRVGTYAECVIVAPGTGVGGVTLQNEGFDSAQTTFTSILDGTGSCDAASATPGPVVTVLDQSTVQGFTIKNGGDSVVVGLGAVTIATNVISGGSTTSIGGGIYLSTGANLTDPAKKAQITGNSITTNTAAEDGAGVYVDASADLVPSVVEISGNSITGNSTGGAVGAFGGGLTVFTNTQAATDTSTVTITANLITGNTAKNATAGVEVAYGGGIFVATGNGNGAGTESVTIGGSTAGTGNIVRGNVSGGFGGGISVNLQPVAGATHTIRVQGNAVTSNTGPKGGGGIHAFARATDVTGAGAASLDVEANTMTGNHAPGAPTDFGGGGLFAEMYMFRTPAGSVSFQATRNSITRNDAASFGGGASLLVYASDDPNADGATAPSDATMEFKNNLLAANDAVGSQATGGGEYAFVEANGGQATATLDNDFLTVASNAADIGGAGLEWDALASPNSSSTSGTTTVTLENSIISGNLNTGVGVGTVPGPGVSFDISYDDGFGTDPLNPAAGVWDPLLGVSPGTNGVIAVDPALDTLFIPSRCSPTIDAGDPADGIDPMTQQLTGELQPNGNRVNLGHLGGTASAIRTLPDVNGDGQVDGLDVLAVAVSFGAVSPDPRYLAVADRDFNGTVDGDDLSFVAAFFGQACP